MADLTPEARVEREAVLAAISDEIDWYTRRAEEQQESAMVVVRALRGVSTSIAQGEHRKAADAPDDPTPRAPRVLTVVLADTQRTYIAVTFEGEAIPYRRRTVHVDLTDGQRAALAPRCTGANGGNDTYEEIAGVWFEPVDLDDEEAPDA